MNENEHGAGSQAVDLGAVLITSELARRVPRAPDLEREVRALHRLAQHLCREPRALLDELVALARELCGADTAGVSLPESAGETRPGSDGLAVAGGHRPCAESSASSTPSPGDITLECGSPQLFRRPHRYCASLRTPAPGLEELLVVPLQSEGEVLGTIWVATYSTSRRFDAEDVRLLTSLGSFSAAALRAKRVSAEHAHRHREAQARLAERQVIEDELRESELRFRQLAERVEAGFWMADYPAAALRYMSSGYQRLWGLEPTEFYSGRRSWLDLVHPGDRGHLAEGLRQLKAGAETYEAKYRIVLPDGSVRWVTDRVAVIERDAAGGLRRLSGVAVDVTERESLVEQLDAERRRLDAVLERLQLAARALRGYVYDWDVASGTIMHTEGFRELFGYEASEAPPSYDGWRSLTHPDDLAPVERQIQEAIARGSAAFSIEYRVRHKSGRYVWIWDHAVLVRAEPDAQHPHGRLVRVVGNVLDVSARRRAEELRELLLRELSHRVKNTLAVVQSIASQTLRTAPSLELFREAFEGRLASLAAAHDLLTGTGWSNADLETLVRRTFAAQAADDRVAMRGPAIALDPNAAVSLGLATHELVTNARKYGALSRAGGRVLFEWSVEGRESGKLLRLRWSERGGPPVVAPARRGFGTRLIEQLARELSAEIELRFEPPGFELEVLVPLERRPKPGDPTLGAASLAPPLPGS